MVSNVDTIAFERSSTTFKSILDENKGAGPGFDLLRIGLAVAILYGHSTWVAGHVDAGTSMEITRSGINVASIHPLDGPIRPFTLMLLPMFFALSGFLVTGSSFRVKNVFVFLSLRGLRIFPALCVETLLSAILLGAFFTTLPLGEYFSSPTFFRYLGNIVGWISYELPGVFEQNPVPFIVNSNLRTLPSEFDCYFLISILFVSGILHNRMLFSWIFVVASIALLAANVFGDFGVTPTIFDNYTITYYFFVGCFFYNWRDKLIYSKALFCLCVIASYGMLLSRHMVYIAPIFVTYVTVYIGLTKLPRVGFISSGDYSYGVYLYGFPISQAIMATYPDLRGHRWVVLALSILFTGLFAAFSWHVIEKRVLRLKRYLSPRPGRVPSEAPPDGATVRR